MSSNDRLLASVQSALSRRMAQKDARQRNVQDEDIADLQAARGVMGDATQLQVAGMQQDEAATQRAMIAKQHQDALARQLANDAANREHDMSKMKYDYEHMNRLDENADKRQVALDKNNEARLLRQEAHDKMWSEEMLRTKLTVQQLLDEAKKNRENKTTNAGIAASRPRSSAVAKDPVLSVLQDNEREAATHLNAVESVKVEAWDKAGQSRKADAVNEAKKALSTAQQKRYVYTGYTDSPTTSGVPVGPVNQPSAPVKSPWE